MYLLGTKFVAVVDHKPLLPLYNKVTRPKQGRVDDTEVYVNRLIQDQLPQAITRKLLRRETAKGGTLHKLMEDINAREQTKVGFRVPKRNQEVLNSPKRVPERNQEVKIWRNRNRNRNQERNQ